MPQHIGFSVEELECIFKTSSAKYLKSMIPLFVDLLHRFVGKDFRTLWGEAASFFRSKLQHVLSYSPTARPGEKETHYVVKRLFLIIQAIISIVDEIRSVCGASKRSGRRGGLLSPVFQSMRPDGIECCKYCRADRFVRELKDCGRCKMVQYCSLHCQKEDWAQHKQLCKIIKAKKKEGQAMSRKTG
jgi:hypothetical protein